MRYALAFSIALICLIGSLSRAAPPRYKLAPGQEIVLEGAQHFPFDKGSYDWKNTLRVWVIRANPDGSWRIVGEQSQQYKDSRSQRNDPPRIFRFYADLFPDGRIPSNPSIGLTCDPWRFFPALPPDAPTASDHWSRDANDVHTEYAAKPSPDPGEFIFTADPQDVFEKIYGIDFSWTIHFDVARGLIEKIEGSVKQDWGIVGKGTDMMELKSVATKDLACMEKFGRETEAYFSARKNCEQMLEASKDPNTFDAAVQQARQTYRAAAAMATLPEVKRLYDDEIKSLNKRQGDAKEQLHSRATVLAAPAADWQAKDLNGQSHALKDYRGKIVILDFWYRGCGWCMRAMPHVIELSENYKGKPVVVLGMNTDKKREDAQFVVDTLKIPYPILSIGDDVTKMYHVNDFGFPTLVVIDQTGVARDLHVGYSPDLREKVGKTVDELLSTKQ